MFFNFYDWTQDEDNIYIFGGRWVHSGELAGFILRDILI
jgi:hypothetical protein